MQRKFRKFKNKMKREFQKLLNRIALVFKLVFVLIIIFFMVLLLITKPSEFVSDYFINHAEQNNNESWITEEEFIQLVKPVAKEVEKTHGTRPSILIAQAALESDWGNSDLSKESNNYFGIKGPNGTEYATKEYYDDEWENIHASFKHYDSIEDSIIDYANLIKNGTTWDPDFYLEVIEATNYKDAAHAVQKAGYATDPEYASKLIYIIEEYHLYEIDN